MGPGQDLRMIKLLIIFLCFGCGDQKELNNDISPPLEIKLSQLTDNGYTFDQSNELITRSFGDYSIWYHFISENDLIVRRTIFLKPKPFSEVKDWIEENGGILLTDTLHLNGSYNQFFIKAVNSGLILQGFYSTKFIFIIYDYPQKEIFKFRKFDEQGNPELKYHLNGKPITIKLSFE
jgi:hypothetical protein